MAQSNKLHLIFFLLIIYISGAQSVTFRFRNNCPYTVWPATLANPGKPQLSTTGFELRQGATSNVGAPVGWQGRIWARSRCGTDGSGRFSCATADCGSGQVACNGRGGNPPATLIEITLNGGGGNDYYDISNVDGFNIRMAVAPIGRCASASCAGNINGNCPNELAVRGGDNAVIACKSACLAFNTPQYCCTGPFLNACPPTSYSNFFHNLCPQAYSYARDDSRTFACASGADYALTFCP